jgi:hypothetical protein
MCIFNAVRVVNVDNHVQDKTCKHLTFWENHYNRLVAWSRALLEKLIVNNYLITVNTTKCVSV